MPFDLDQYAGAGQETLTDSASMPILALLQDMSPETKKQKQEYIEGAEPGMVLSKDLMELVPTPFKVIFIAMTPLYTEWKSRNDGGGFMGFHSMSIVSDPNYRKGSEQNKYAEFLGNNDLKYTYYWSVRYFHNNEWHNGIIAMSGSQLKVGRELQQAIKRLKTPSGKPAPIFAYTWDASNVFVEGEKGDYFGWQFKNPTALDPEADAELLQLVVSDYKNSTQLLPAPTETETETQTPQLTDGDVVDVAENEVF